MNVQSIFSIGGVNYSVEGYGQESVGTIISKFPNRRIFFLGFMINGKFVKFDPTTSAI